MLLDFSDDMGAKRFDFVFAGFVLGGSLRHETKGLTLLRREVAIFEKLEALSEPKPCGKKLPNGEPDRQLKADGPKQLHLDGPEYDLLYNYLCDVPWSAGSPARHAVATIDWLSACHRNGSAH